jgi:AraC family transcriptional regulator of arabinose operon
MALPRRITPLVNAAPLVCSEFRRGLRYTNWRPRGSGDWLLIYTVSGAGSVVLEGRVEHLKPGEAVLFCPTACQDYSTDRAIGGWHLQWAHFIPKPHWRPWLMWPETARGVGWLDLGRAGVAAHFSHALDRMLVAKRLGGIGGIDLAMNALEEALIWTCRAIAADPLSRRDERVRRAVQFLASLPSKPFVLDDLAKYCGLSPSRLSHLFKSELQTTPRQFGERIRLEYAQQLLTQTNLPIAQIARETGFSDQLYFSRRFRLFEGRSPSNFRDRR